MKPVQFLNKRKLFNFVRWIQKLFRASEHRIELVPILFGNRVNYRYPATTNVYKYRPRWTFPSCDRPLGRTFSQFNNLAREIMQSYNYPSRSCGWRRIWSRMKSAWYTAESYLPCRVFFWQILTQSYLLPSKLEYNP